MKFTNYLLLKSFKSNKKGIELALQTIVIFIILLIVLGFMVLFFSTHYTDNSNSLINIGNQTINQVKSGLN